MLFMSPRNFVRQIPILCVPCQLVSAQGGVLLFVCKPRVIIQLSLRSDIGTWSTRSASSTLGWFAVIRDEGSGLSGLRRSHWKRRSN